MSTRTPSLSPPPVKRRRISPPPSCATAIPPAPSPSHLRIVSWNINGISAYLQAPITSFFHRLSRSPSRTSRHSFTSPSIHPSPPSVSRHTSPSPASLRACLRRWHWPQIICLQEVKIASHDKTTQNRVRHAVNAKLDAGEGDEGWGYDAYFALPRDKHNARGSGGKIYGVCTLVRRDVTGSVEGVGWDLEGRVLVAKLEAGGKTAVVNLYAVNGTENSYRDPETGAVVGTRHTWKRRSHRRLASTIRSLEAQSYSVVVAGDFNIARSPLDGYPGRRMGAEHVANRIDFEEVFVRELGMRDTFRELNGEMRRFSYRPRGRRWGESMDRVDLILAGRGLLVREAGIGDEVGERGRSDHCPCWVGVDWGNGRS